LFFSRIIFVWFLAGETCVNNEDMNGTVFGQFRCPLYGFPHEAKYCCGEYGKQFCCVPDRRRFIFEKKIFFFVFLNIVLFFLVIFLLKLHILDGLL